MTKKKRLGRGLEALLNATGTPQAESSPPASAPSPADTQFAEPGAADHEPIDPMPVADEDEEGALVNLNVYEIDDNPFQPRRDFSETEIASLSESLKEHDMLQPVLVRKIDGRYQLISGERRLRAAIQAGWSTIPARIRDADDRLVAELAIVENLQRKDLNPLEKALSFRRYIDQHGCTQEDLAGRLKIDRSTLSNLMRLLELPRAVQDALRIGSITAGHARALLPLGDEHVQVDFCNKAQQDGWSVRQTEQLVAERIDSEDGPVAGKTKSPKPTRDSQIDALEKELKRALGTKVDVRQTRRGNGRIVIHFSNNDEFGRLREFLTISDTSQLKRAG